MSVSLALQYGLIMLAVGASAIFVVQKQWPAALRQARIAFALPLLREGSSKPMQALGRLIAPRPNAAKTGCGSCDSCS
ncbi:MAG: DUF6587 family protein [Luteimonas sp.]